MESLRLTNILKAIKGQIVSGHGMHQIRHVAIRPEEIGGNTLYFHLQGNTHQVSSLRPSVVYVTEKPELFLKQNNRRITIIKVKKVRDAYRRFIHYYRHLFSLPVIGVTGTCGKTTTTEMIKKILSQRYQSILGTIDGKNNLSNNLPYLLMMNRKTEAAVFEMGVSHPGCIETSCRYFQPQVGIILNIGVYHLLGCKTLDNYIKAKAEMVTGITPGGTLVVPAEDQHVQTIDLSQFSGKVVYFGWHERSHYRATELKSADGGIHFTLHHAGQTFPFFLPGHGEHNVLNALAAVAATHAIGIPIDLAAKGLASFQPVRSHLEFRRGIRGCTIIDDTWNCTPPSMESALQVLKSASTHKKKIAVLGYMPQLGKNARYEYDNMAKKVVETGVDKLILIGEAKRIGKKALQLGMNKRRIFFCETAEEVYRALIPDLNKGSLVLFKFPYKFRLSKLASFRKFMNVMLHK